MLGTKTPSHRAGLYNEGYGMGELLLRICFNHVLTGISRVISACRIGISRMNVQGYADDILVFAPT